jgi:hypothetical protein
LRGLVKARAVVFAHWWQPTWGTKWFFVYGFGKNQQANIDADEEVALKKLAETLLQMTPRSVSKALEAAELIEVECDA